MNVGSINTSTRSWLTFQWYCIIYIYAFNYFFGAEGRRRCVCIL